MGRAAAAAVLILACLLLQDGAGSARNTATRGKVVFVNVGQGDGVVIKLGSTIVVSDVGEHNAATVDETLRELGAKRIDVAILGHPHDDHVRNLLTLVRDYHWQIGLTVISESQWWQGTKTNRAIIDLLEAEHVRIEVATRSERFHWGGGDWLILNPPKGEFLGGSPQAANVSIAYLLTYNGVRALFTGDIEPQVARRIAGELQPELDEPVDISSPPTTARPRAPSSTCSTSRGRAGPCSRRGRTASTTRGRRRSPGSSESARRSGAPRRTAASPRGSPPRAGSRGGPACSTRPGGPAGTSSGTAPASGGSWLVRRHDDTEDGDCPSRPGR